jgi:hypothetical protein
MPLSPFDASVDMDLAVRLKISPYGHPIGIPIGGVVWQVSASSDFSSFIFNEKIITASDSLVLTEDEQLIPYLAVGTRYFWRAKYFDLKDEESEWSEVWEFETSITGASDVILQPNIVYPVNEGYMPETDLFTQVSQPTSVGTAQPNKLDLQVSITQDFNTADIIQEYQDQDNLTIVRDTTVNFSSAPSPLFIRARHKDTARNIISQWSHAPTVWLQRVYSGLVIGAEMNISSNSFVRRIDEEGNPVSVPTQYFDDSPVFGTMQPTQWEAGLYAASTNSAVVADKMQDMVRLQKSYWKADTIEVDGQLKHRVWVSPVPKDGFYLHPAFARCDVSLLVSACLLNLKNDGQNFPVSRLGTPASAFSTSTWGCASVNSVHTLFNNTGQKAEAYNIHVRMLLQMLMLVEKSAFVPSGGGTTNGPECLNYRGIFSIFHLWDGTYTCAVGCQGYYSTEGAVVQYGDPFNPEVLTPLGNTSSAYNRVPCYVNSIKTGYDSFLGCDSELYMIPLTTLTSSEGGVINRYYNAYNSGNGLQNTRQVVEVSEYFGSLVGRSGSIASPTHARFIVLE